MIYCNMDGYGYTLLKKSKLTLFYLKLWKTPQNVLSLFRAGH